ncbi:C-terminal helicase domain-containing protein [Candidatus Poriferisodalis sp.]|uniref:C-terminal helicase domain-containing protein n=1 Tax=Candidatus Poriferisodalis sp. TaxID=3101277 RepID=UPI003B0124AB
MEAFFTLLGELRRSERDPDVKLLVFTEFIPTQQMLLERLEAAGVSAVAINGGMSLGERVLAQDAFRDDAQVLVSTDAGGEGINLQFAHVVVNWDLPWSPSRIEQRTGRVDRIASLVEVATRTRETLNRPDANGLDVLAALPEMAPGEPCPVIQVAEATPGWLSIWEVTSDGTDRNATAVFHPDAGLVRPDAGLVRPDLAVTLWDRCCDGVAVADQQTPNETTWLRIIEQGIDHAYQAAARLAGAEGLTLPAARLRLLVRVDS